MPPSPLEAAVGFLLSPSEPSALLRRLSALRSARSLGGALALQLRLPLALQLRLPLLLRVRSRSFLFERGGEGSGEERDASALRSRGFLRDRAGDGDGLPGEELGVASRRFLRDALGERLRALGERLRGAGLAERLRERGPFAEGSSKS
mmetsp:Transcript_48291/g.87233  ORF Transcript_48291/g.87233 Transcript_48291/m.87233 type:complete len:149 (+) Transcript_48291:155-601(+)